MITEFTKHSSISHSVGFLLLLMALTDVLQSKAFLVGSALLAIVIFVFTFPIKNRSFFMESMFVILVLLSTSILNLFFTQNNIGGSLTLIGHLFFAFIYLQLDSKKLTAWVVASYAVTIVFIAYHLFVLRTHENFIYEGLSRNHAGFAVVFYTIFLLFHIKVNYDYISLIPPLISLILSFFLVGRTSLIVSSLLLLVVFFYKFQKNTKLMAAALALCCGFGYFLWIKFGSNLLSETNLDAGLDTPRWKLWAVYWEYIDFKNIFTGVDVTKLQMYTQYNGNPHNSFIKFHSRTGVGSLFFLVLLFVSVFKYLKRQHYFTVSLLMLLTLRAMFDGDMFIGNFDFIFLILTFYWIKTDLYEPYHINSNRSLQ